MLALSRVKNAIKIKNLRKKGLKLISIVPKQHY